MLPWGQRHLPSSQTTSVFKFWASLSPAAATVAPSSPRQSRPHLAALQWAEGEGLVQPEPIHLYCCCSSAISQWENQQMCVTTKNPWHAPSPLLSPLNLYQIPHRLCQNLCICDWDAVKGLPPSVCSGHIIYYKLKSNEGLQMLGIVLLGQLLYYCIIGIIVLLGQLLPV